jgi:hypothetical protein
MIGNGELHGDDGWVRKRSDNKELHINEDGVMEKHCKKCALLT